MSKLDLDALEAAAAGLSNTRFRFYRDPDYEVDSIQIMTDEDGHWIDFADLSISAPDDCVEPIVEILNNADALIAEVKRLRTALVEAIELAEEGWENVGDYFRDKWECVERIEKLRALVKGVF